MARPAPTPARRLPDWVVLVLALVVLAVGIVVAIARPATAEQFATLHPLAGLVEVGRDGEELIAGREGQTLEEGDTIRTGADGRAEIEYFDGGVTRMDVETTFTLQELATI